MQREFIFDSLCKIIEKPDCRKEVQLACTKILFCSINDKNKFILDIELTNKILDKIYEK